jgi:hypothetical protein
MKKQLPWEGRQMTRNRCALMLVVVFLAGSPAIVGADYSVTDLVDAAKRGDGHAVHKLIENGTDLDARGPMGYTALHWAGIRGNWRIFAELVAAGAPVDAKGSDGGTPLHWTCHHDRPDAVRLLLDAGAEVEVQNQWGRTPLHVAARRGCLDVAELLLDAGADPNATTKEGWTPMHVAARSGQESMLNLLETRGADPTRTDSDNLTACRSWKRRPRPVPADTSSLAEYEGIYDLGGGFSMKVWREGDGLRLREFAPDGLIPVGVDEFSCLQEPWIVRFLRGDNGDITTIEVDFLRRTIRGQKTDAPRYVGSKVCMNCHTGTDQGQQDVHWMRSRHAHAFWRLGSDWSLFLAGLRPHYQDLENPIADDRCLLCHVTGFQDPDALYESAYRAQEGVSCEACHGPGSKYSTVDVMADRVAFLANGGQIPDAETCQSCHRNSDNFDWAEFWPKIAHPKPAPSTDSDE